MCRVTESFHGAPWSCEDGTPRSTSTAVARPWHSVAFVVAEQTARVRPARGRLEFAQRAPVVVDHDEILTSCPLIQSSEIWLTYTPFAPKMECMDYIPRTLGNPLRRALARGKSLFLFGARQTGKTTLVDRIPCALRVSLSLPDVRLRYERSPGLLRGEVEALKGGGAAAPLIVLDEVQKVPGLLDEVQDLVDRGRARFILTGSSARKLRRGMSANLLPGRVLVFHLDPLSLRERVPSRLEDALTDGSLPGIVAVQDATDREADLAAYVQNSSNQADFSKPIGH